MTSLTHHLTSVNLPLTSILQTDDDAKSSKYYDIKLGSEVSYSNCCVRGHGFHSHPVPKHGSCVDTLIIKIVMTPKGSTKKEK